MLKILKLIYQKAAKNSLKMIMCKKDSLIIRWMT
jgi:hypothetical protein